MAITFTPKPNHVEVEVEGFGKVRVRHYGAGEELQLAKDVRELDELQKRGERLLADLQTKAKKDGEDAELTPELQKEFNAVQKRVGELSDELNAITRSVLSSEDPTVAERIFNELPVQEVRRLINFALKKGDQSAKA